MKVSKFFKEDISPFLLGAFFGRYQISIGKKYIYSTSSYKVSSFIGNKEIYTHNINIYVEKLNLFSKVNIWTLNSPSEIRKSQISAILENDLGLSIKSFYNKLHFKILSDELILGDTITEAKKMFIRGFMELRGSIDTTALYISQDYFFNNAFELKRARLLIDYLNVPVEELNFNFRELQKQFVEHVNMRNSQLRINLTWYLKNIGLMNNYKTEIIKIKLLNFKLKEIIDGIFYFDTPIRNSSIASFEKRLIKYTSNIFGKDLNSIQIARLREELAFDKNDKRQFTRNKSIVELVRLLTEDKCACCKDLYNINDRTFMHRRTGKLYFEIHHVISLNNKIELDDENNLVKLCPVCHSALKMGVGEELTQKSFIRNILDNSSQALEFAKHIFNTDDINYIIDKVYEHLK